MPHEKAVVQDIQTNKNKVLSDRFVLFSCNASSACFRDYAAIVFFANNRFETGKRKLQYLTFQDFAFCAGQLINSWTIGAVGERFLLFLLASLLMYGVRTTCTIFFFTSYVTLIKLNGLNLS